jgi:tryptophanyl-tRNA synthetase
VLDEPDEIRRKFMTAVTDSRRDIVRHKDKAGITNLIEIAAAVRGIEPEKEYANASGYARFKRNVGEAVVDLLAPVQKRYAEMSPDEEALGDVLARGSERARAIASATLRPARQRMGFGSGI